MAAVITVQANNDNVPAPPALDNNIVVPLKRFDHSDYIDLEFATFVSRGVTEYSVSEFVDNNTGTPWSGYRMVLGYGTGANFVQSAAGDGLDFDAPDYDTSPTSGAFATWGAPNEDTLVFSNGTHNGGAQPYSFRIDVPDLANFDGYFTLRQIPEPVPEPSVFALVAMGLMAAATLRRS